MNRFIHETVTPTSYLIIQPQNKGYSPILFLIQVIKLNKDFTKI